jgi:hypothetical protein
VATKLRLHCTVRAPPGLDHVVTLASRTGTHVAVHVDLAEPSRLSRGARWMRDLGDDLLALRLRELVLPGAHDACTDSLTHEFAPRAPRWLATMAPRGFTRKWAVTQGCSVASQLAAGVRYLDVRVHRVAGAADASSAYRIEHMLLGDLVLAVLDAVDAFCASATSAREIVLVDMNHFYGMGTGHDTAHHRELMGLIERHPISRRAIPHDPRRTVGSCIAAGTNVILAYHHALARAHPFFWPGASALRSPFPNVSRRPALIAKLGRFLADEARSRHLFSELPARLTGGGAGADAAAPRVRDPSDAMFVVQGVFTPNAEALGRSLTGAAEWRSLRELAVEANLAVGEWMTDPAQLTSRAIGVVMVDFAACTPAVQICRAMTEARAAEAARHQSFRC